jgi:replicative DNA helicase
VSDNRTKAVAAEKLRLRRKNLAEDVVYTPPEVSALAIQLVKARMNDDYAGIPSGLSTLDAVMNPMGPGDLITVIGRPANYKSGLMQYIIRQHAYRIAADQVRFDKKCCVYVSWEQSAEEMAIIEIAAAAGENLTELLRGKPSNGKALMKAAIGRGALPIWIIGHSVERRRRRPRLTMTDVFDSLMALEDEWGLHPDLVVLDYLQRIMPEGNKTIREQNITNVDASKDLAVAMGCSVILGCQAKREVDGRAVPIPTMGDGAETANVEQSSDKILTVWMPKTTTPVGSMLPMELGYNLPVTKNMLFVSFPKQKLGDTGGPWLMYVDPGQNKIAPMEVRSIAL